jgi:hypothetical protein
MPPAGASTRTAPAAGNHHDTYELWKEGFAQLDERLVDVQNALFRLHSAILQPVFESVVELTALLSL